MNQHDDEHRALLSPYVGIGRLTLLQLMAGLAVLGIVVTFILHYFFAA